MKYVPNAKSGGGKMIGKYLCMLCGFKANENEVVIENFECPECGNLSIKYLDDSE